MAKRKKKAETHRWRAECPDCGHECPAAVRHGPKTVTVSFECHNCGRSNTARLRGEEAKQFR